MPLYGDVGMPAGALPFFFFLLLWVPALVLAFMARRRWRLGAARQEEVRMLALLAAEETTRAELEAMEAYAASWTSDRTGASAAVSAAMDALGRSECAVCSSPAAARCGRCKAVRYCSGKCQIIHWRHGHKDECHHPIVNYKDSGEINISGLKAVQAKQPCLLDEGSDSEPKEERNTIAVNAFPVPSESASDSARRSDLNEYDKNTENTPANVSVKKNTCCFAAPPVISHLISNVKTSKDALTGGKPSEPPVAGLGESSPSGSPTISLGRTVATCDENLNNFPSPEFPRSNVLANPTYSSNGVQENASAAKTEQDGSMFSSPSHITATASLEDRNSEMTSVHQVHRVGEGSCKGAESRKEGPSGASASSEANSRSNPKEMPSSNIETSRSVANGTIIDMKLQKSRSSGHLALSSGQVTSNDGALHVASSKSSKVSNSSRAHIRSPDTSGAIENGFSVVSAKSSTSGSIANGMRTDVRLPNAEISRSLASAPDELSADSGNHPKGFSESSNVDNGHGGPIISPDTSDATTNVLATSSMRVIKQITSRKISKHYSSELMLFPYDLFIKLYSPEKTEFHPCGLMNCGNSCYANAVLQCLAFTRPLTAYLLEGLHSKKCPKKEWCFTCEFESLVVSAKQGKSPLSPIGILSHLQNIGSNFGHGQQEDAHEFLRYAVNAMQFDCLRESGAKPDSLLADETTLMQQTFGGYLRSKIRCSKCKGKSERCERMLDLTVEINGDVATLHEALSRFTSSEILDGKNMYECARCKSYERARKRLTILEAPNILTIVLKRFQSGKFGKLNKAVQFPEYLNLAEFMSGDDTSPVYQLYAVVVHIDVMNASYSGHYVCYVKDTQCKWYKINDSEVEPVTLDKVLSKEAYMLLYARCSPRAPHSVRKAMAHEQARKARHKEVTGGTPGTSSAAEQKNHRHLPQQMTSGTPSFQPSDLFERPSPPKRDSSSDSSSLFDEGSSCSTESTRDSASAEDSTSMSGESDGVNPNSPSRVPVQSDGLTPPPPPPLPSFGDSSKAAVHRSTPDLPRRGDCGKDQSSSDGQTDRAKPRSCGAAAHPTGNGILSLRSSGKSGDCKDVGGQRNWTLETDAVVKSSVLLRRPSRERTSQTIY